MNLLARFDPGDSVTELFIVMLQTSIVILLAALLARTGLRRRAEARHVLWLGALVFVLISPSVATIARRSGVALRVIASPVAGHEPNTVAENQGRSHDISQSNSSRPVFESTDGSLVAETAPRNEAMEVTPVARAQSNTSRAVAPGLNQRASALSGGLAVLWAIGVLAGIARIAVGWQRVEVLSRSTRMLDPVRYGRALERVRTALGIAALPPVLTSPTVRAPVTVGLWSPRVILPEGLAESLESDSLRDVLVHECAHVVRLDAWVGLLQRLAGTLYWPHPLVYYASGQLTQAREEVCDNHVLQCGDPRSYARTLLALTEEYLPMGAVRPGLGLLGARWTLADRVAGLLDTRRISMTRTTFRMRIVLGAALIFTTLAAVCVRLDGPALANGTQINPAAPRAAAAPAVWSVVGTVVDERGRAVAGAIVHAAPEDRTAGGFKTTADGAFSLPFGGRSLHIWGVVAETDGGAEIGVVRFEDARLFTDRDPVKIVLKPSRPVRVRVSDAAGSPVAGAAVEAIEASFRTGAKTGLEGTATLRVAADAKVERVIGLKSGSGFDYFENYHAWPAPDYPPLPAEVALVLDGAQTVRVKAVDSKGEPVPGVELGPAPLMKLGKVAQSNIRASAATWATTDRQGFATFDWLPKSGAGGFRFSIVKDGDYSSRDVAYTNRGGQAKLTTNLLRDTRLSGTVRFPGGRPAGGMLIAAGGGIRGGRRVIRAARTLADGSYVLDAPSESAYIIAVVDETWSASSLSNVIVREGQAQGGLDLTLTKGTLLHGQITEPPDQQPVASAIVDLSEQGGPLPKELRGGDFRPVQLGRTFNADANGRYHFRVGPGRYTLRSRNAGGTEPLTVDVKNEAEIVRDLALKGPASASYLSGVVIEKTPTGDRPVPRTRVSGLRAGFPGRFSIADDQGRFRLPRVPGEWCLYAANHERSLAALMPVTAAADNVRIVVSKAAPTVTGRVIDSDGTPQAARGIGVRLETGPDVARAGGLELRPMTDEHGRYSVSAAPVGSYVQVSVSHRMIPDPTSPRTVVKFEVFDTDPIVIPDLIVPAKKPTN